MAIECFGAAGASSGFMYARNRDCPATLKLAPEFKDKWIWKPKYIVKPGEYPVPENYPLKPGVTYVSMGYRNEPNQLIIDEEVLRAPGDALCIRPSCSDHVSTDVHVELVDTELRVTTVTGRYLRKPNVWVEVYPNKSGFMELAELKVTRMDDAVDMDGNYPLSALDLHKALDSEMNLFAKK